MNFLYRLYDGLLHPKDVHKYSEDKCIYPIMHFIILIILILVPTIVSIIFSNPFPKEIKDDLKYAFINGQEIPYIIEDNKLKYVGTEIEKTYYYIESNYYKIYFTSYDNFTPQKSNVMLSFLGEKTTLIFKSDGLYTSSSSNAIFQYKSIDFNGFSFKEAKNGSFEYYDQIFGKITKMLDYIKEQTLPIDILLATFEIASNILLLSLICTLITRINQKQYHFKKQWKLTIYLLTPFIFGELFAILFSINIIYYIGLIITIKNCMSFNQRM